MVVQLGFRAFIAMACIRSIPGQGTKILQSVQSGNKTKQKTVRSCYPWCMWHSLFGDFSGCPWSGFYIPIPRACHTDAAGSQLSPAPLDVRNQKTLCSAWFSFTPVWPDQVSLRCCILTAAHSATCFRSHISSSAKELCGVWK